VLGLAEAVGEPVTVTFVWEGGGDAERAVLVPAAVPAHPADFGAFTLYRRRVEGRTAVARHGVLVAELLDPDEAHWLQEQARRVRQGFMDPQQKAAFEEFLARQAYVDDQ
jgi:hypothetical protein